MGKVWLKFSLGKLQTESTIRSKDRAPIHYLLYYRVEIVENRGAFLSHYWPINLKLCTFFQIKCLKNMLEITTLTFIQPSSFNTYTSRIILHIFEYTFELKYSFRSLSAFFSPLQTLKALTFVFKVFSYLVDLQSLFRLLISNIF